MDNQTFQSTHIATTGTFVLNGGPLVISASGIERGIKAAQMVENLIENEIYINEMPGETNDLFGVYMCHTASNIQRNYTYPKFS